MQNNIKSFSHYINMLKFDRIRYFERCCRSLSFFYNNFLDNNEAMYDTDNYLTRFNTGFANTMNSSIVLFFCKNYKSIEHIHSSLYNLQL